MNIGTPLSHYYSASRCWIPTQKWNQPHHLPSYLTSGWSYHSCYLVLESHIWSLAGSWGRKNSRLSTMKCLHMHKSHKSEGQVNKQNHAEILKWLVKIYCKSDEWNLKITWKKPCKNSSNHLARYDTQSFQAEVCSEFGVVFLPKRNRSATSGTRDVWYTNKYIWCTYMYKFIYTYIKPYIYICAQMQRWSEN